MISKRASEKNKLLVHEQVGMAAEADSTPCTPAPSILSGADILGATLSVPLL